MSHSTRSNDLPTERRVLWTFYFSFGACQLTGFGIFEPGLSSPRVIYDFISLWKKMFSITPRCLNASPSVALHQFYGKSFPLLFHAYSWFAVSDGKRNNITTTTKCNVYFLVSFYIYFHLNQIAFLFLFSDLDDVGCNGVFTFHGAVHAIHGHEQWYSNVL